MSAPSCSSITTTVLGKRKERTTRNYVLRLESPTYDAHTGSEFETGSSTSSIAYRSPRKPVIPKHFACEYDGCDKTYSKLSRLTEHMRSHTGDRPYVCAICSKSYLRESHLHAHARSHQDQSARPLACDEPGCDKRFWTAQHLRVHRKLHQGEIPFKCTEASCAASFFKHHQLREHICSVHEPPGTKPYRCTYDGCNKSFSTNQHLRTHSRVHDDKRYTCVNPACLAIQSTDPTFYSTWTALQHHIRTAHPPTCPHSSCNGKTFSAQKGLRAHLKIHEQREVEEGLNAVASDGEEDGNAGTTPASKKRRGGEVGRDWVCDIDGCIKDFKSKKALRIHQKVNHEGRRDFVCSHETCGRAFGYKHLLQRHLAKLHATHTQSDSPSDEGEGSSAAPALQFDIDKITGKSYRSQAAIQLSTSQKLQCPYPDLRTLLPDIPDSTARLGHKQCDYVFSRAYDLHRHLLSEHGADIEKNLVTAWVQRAKACHP